MSTRVMPDLVFKHFPLQNNHAVHLLFTNASVLCLADGPFFLYLIQSSVATAHVRFKLSLLTKLDVYIKDAR